MLHPLSCFSAFGRTSQFWVFRLDFCSRPTDAFKMGQFEFLVVLHHDLKWHFSNRVFIAVKAVTHEKIQHHIVASCVNIGFENGNNPILNLFEMVHCVPPCDIEKGRSFCSAPWIISSLLVFRSNLQEDKAADDKGYQYDSHDGFRFH